MAKQVYALEKGGPRRLEVSWKASWRDVTVRLDGVVIGTAAGQKELLAGPQFALPDGTRLKVQLVRRLTGAELVVTRGGQPLPDSTSDPETRVLTAAWVLFIVGGLNIVLGLLGLAFRTEFLAALGAGWYSLVFGALFLSLGFLARRRSITALVSGIVLLAGDGILGFVAALSAGVNPGVGGILVRALLLIPLVQGIGAVRALRRPSADRLAEVTRR
jgi:hypothetical protein